MDIEGAASFNARGIPGMGFLVHLTFSSSTGQENDRLR